MLKDWIIGEIGDTHDLLRSWENAQTNGKTPNWGGATGAKLLSWKLPPGVVIANATILGGVCTIFNGDEQEINGIKFQSAAAFEDWMRLWYPRIDQIHDTVGIPFGGVQQVVYVCEDSLFGRRIARWTGLDAEEVGQVLRLVHEEIGHPVVERWFRRWGYRGLVKVVYTSDLEPQLDVALRFWERIGGVKKPAKGRIDLWKVKLMYTAFWLDVLGISGPAIIYEPANHINPSDYPRDLLSWFLANPYGEPESFNAGVGFAAFMPFWSTRGITRMLSRDQVPHQGNWKDFQIPDGDTLWYGANLLFGQKAIGEHSPVHLSPEEIRRRIAQDLQAYYRGD